MLFDGESILDGPITGEQLIYSDKIAEEDARRAREAEAHYEAAHGLNRVVRFFHRGIRRGIATLSALDSEAKHARSEAEHDASVDELNEVPFEFPGPEDIISRF